MPARIALPVCELDPNLQRLIGHRRTRNEQFAPESRRRNYRTLRDQPGVKNLLEWLRGWRFGHLKTVYGSSSLVLSRFSDGARLWKFKIAPGSWPIAVAWQGGHVVSHESREGVDELTVAVFDRAGTRVASLGRQWEILSADFSRTGRRIVTAGGRTVRVWDLQGNEIMVIESVERDFASAEFSPDGKYILTACQDGLARLWFSRPEDLVDWGKGRVTRDFTSEELKTYGPLLK